jgi:hypothetical protein
MRCGFGIHFALELNTAIEGLHCFAQTPGRHRHDGIGRRFNHFLDAAVLPPGNPRQHELGKIADRMVGFDPQPYPAKLLGAKPFNDRPQTLLAARAALASHPDHTQRKRDIIANNDEVRRVPIPTPFQERPDRITAQVHVRLRFDQKNLLAL